MNKKYLFLHIPKNGGMTIRYAPELNGRINAAVGKYHQDDIQAVRNKMYQLGDHPGLEHARYRDIKPEIFNTHRPFAIIRNPWDRVVSRYFFAKKVIEIEKKVPKEYADIRSLESFLEERFKWGNEEFMWYRAIRCWYPAYDHVCNDKEIFDLKNIDILNFENYDEDCMRYFDLKTNLNPRNITGLNRKKYTDVYNKKTIQIVADWYQKDIDTWGYDFDSGARKNTTYVK